MANRLRDLTVKELSLVDRPANPGAKVVLAKHESEGRVAKDMYQVSRFADLISSLGYLMRSSEYEAQSEGDNSPIPAALRTWLKQGAGIFTSMATEEINELLATATSKREFDAAARRRAASSGAAESDGSFPIENATDLRNAMRAIGRSKNPQKTKAHIRARARALGLTSMLSDAFKSEDSAMIKFMGLFRSLGRATGALSESVKSIIEDDNAADKPTLIDETIKQFSEHVEDELESTLTAGGAVDKSEESDMEIAALKKALGLADTATEAEVTAELAKLAGLRTTVSKLETDLAIAKAAMSDDEKAFHDKLGSDDDKKAFRAMSRDERKAKMAKRDDLPPEIRKALAEAEETKKRLAALEAKNELVTFQKRAVEIGLTEAQGELLAKAHKGDQEALTKLENVIKGLYEQIATGKLFDEFGTQHGASTDAYAEITAKAEALRKVNPKLTIEKAKAMVIEDPANAELMKRYRDEQRAKVNKAV